MKFLQVTITLAGFLAAVYVATFINPVIGGVIAALPLRLGISLYAIALLGDKVALQQAVTGSIIGWISVGIFVGALYLFLPKFSVNISFLLATAFSLTVASIGYGLLQLY